MLAHICWREIGIRYATLTITRDKKELGTTKETEGIMMNRLKDMKGKSLLEVTIAMIVLAFGLLGLAGLHLVSMQSDTLGRQANVASNLAKNKFAELQEANQLTDGIDQYVDEDNGVTYTRRWFVESDNSQADMMTVKIQVSWQGSMVDRCVTVSKIIKRT